MAELEALPQGAEGGAAYNALIDRIRREADAFRTALDDNKKF
jgi:hypothetical protein